MAEQRASQTWNLGPRPGGYSINSVTADTPIVTTRPQGSIVGSTGNRGTTYLDPKTGDVVGFKPPPSRAGQPVQQASFSGGGSRSLGGGGGEQAQAPVEFYLGAAPTIPELDLSGPMSQFRNVFNQINSGVNPNFFVDQDKLAKDAKAVSGQLNLSPAQIKAMIAGINPTAGEIASQVAQLDATLNDPAKIAAKAGTIADKLNEKYVKEFESAMPEYKDNMAKANKLTSDYLTAKLPQDVVDQIFRGSAVKGFATGIYGGGLGRNIVARDLGLTSLQLQTAGANLLKQTAELATNVARQIRPVTGAELAAQFITDPTQLFSTMANYNRVDPTSIFNAVYVPTRQVYEQMANMAQQSTLARANFEASKMVSPDRVFDTLTTVAMYNNQITAQNAINSWQSQPLPGQYDIQRGQFVGFTPGTYSSSKPLPPGTSVPTRENIMAGLKGPYASEIYNKFYAQGVNQAQSQAQNWTGQAYIPQLRG